MEQGLYNLTSEILSEQRNLDVIGHNMVNVSTVGHRADTMTFTTFQDELMVRTGNTDKNYDVPIGHLSMLKTVDRAYTYFGEKGNYDETGLPLDFALKSDGFFQINNGKDTRYTRAGSFIIDDDGYLSLPEGGRVLNNKGKPIFLGTDNIYADSQGNIYDKTNHNKLDTIGIVDFNNYNESLKKDDDGLFQIENNAKPKNIDNPQLLWGYVELSNGNMANEMVKMIAAQRSLQSSSQILKMYDGIDAKMVNDIGRL